METEVNLRRFTAEEYHVLADEGILHSEERLELVDGTIYVMSPMVPREASAGDRLTALFAPLSGRAILRVQRPVRPNDDRSTGTGSRPRRDTGRRRASAAARRSPRRPSPSSR